MGDLFQMPMLDVSMCAPLPTVYEAEEFGKQWILHSHQRRMATFVLHFIDKLIRPMSENPYQTPPTDGLRGGNMPSPECIECQRIKWAAMAFIVGVVIGIAATTLYVFLISKEWIWA